MVELDFSKLMAIKPETKKDETETAKAPTGILEAPTDIGALEWDSEIGDGEKPGKKATGKKDPATEKERSRLADLRKADADRIKQSEKLRRQILKACNGKELDYRTLFLQAAECISLMTGDKVFYNQIRDKVGSSQAE